MNKVNLLKNVNKKFIVLSLIILLGVISIYVGVAYGLFEKKDILTNIDYVAGTLNYKIENSDLTNGSITVGAGNQYKLTLTLTNLNTVDTKYELYYLIDGKKVTDDNITIGYSSETTDTVKGTISANGKKAITIVIKNNGSTDKTITLGCEGGLINNSLVMRLGNSLDQLVLNDDLVVAYTYVGTETAPTRFPNKGEGYGIKSVTCNGMDAEWDNLLWSLTFSNVTSKNITCNFEITDFEGKATEYVMELAKKNTYELRIDKHDAVGQQNFATTEYRYWGNDPNNYVSFNSELWRIIGVFDVDDGTGNVEKRLKIIRANPIGEYSWDSSSTSINGGNGVNEWNQADLMNLLNNGAYYNRTSGTCYNGKSNTITSCDFTNTGLTDEAKEMIGNAKWFLGAIGDPLLTSESYYMEERDDVSGKQCTQGNSYCNDKVERKPFWIGKVGLMYPSDYGYSAYMNSCSSTALTSYQNLCKDFSWLYKNGVDQWTLSPYGDLNDAYGVIGLKANGNMSIPAVYGSSNVFPVTYLKSDIKIIDGVGSDQQPFILSK